MAEWFDLTRPIEPTGPRMPFFPEPRIETLLPLTDRTLRVSQLSICTHSGTHVDAPSHFVDGGKNIDEFPLSRFIVPGVVWRVHAEPMQAITVDALQGLTVEPGWAVLLYTGWADLGNEPRYYDHPYLTDEVCHWFVQSGVSMVGIDFLTPEKPLRLLEASGAPSGFPAHQILLSHEVLIIENLVGLAPLTNRRIELFAVPILVRPNVEAAPARVFARPVS